MNKKILFSFLTIGAVLASVGGATVAYFSDTETSTGNTFTAGTIDISVDGENPWNTSWENYLDKPCETNYMVFDIRNDGSNPANIWKRITRIETSGGDASYCDVASSEPEFEEGGGIWDGDGDCDSSGYEERDNLAAYMVYDLYICKHPYAGDVHCPYVGNDEKNGPDLSGDTHNWEAIIPEEHQVRVDNVGGAWIKLDEELEPGRILRVVQSYHLMAWDDAGEPMITNWAQGDVMTFDIELEARQVGAPAPESEASGVLGLREKDIITWEVVDGGASGTLTYNLSGSDFEYDLSVAGLDDVGYSLIYYADPRPGNHPGRLIGTHVASGGSITVIGGLTNLSMDLPDSADANYPVGAKVWLVPSSAYNSDTRSITNWGEAENFLFEMNLIQYEDTDLR